MAAPRTNPEIVAVYGLMMTGSFHDQTIRAYVEDSTNQVDWANAKVNLTTQARACSSAEPRVTHSEVCLDFLQHTRTPGS